MLFDRAYNGQVRYSHPFWCIGHRNLPFVYSAGCALWFDVVSLMAKYTWSLMHLISHRGYLSQAWHVRSVYWVVNLSFNTEWRPFFVFFHFTMPNRLNTQQSKLSWDDVPISRLALHTWTTVWWTGKTELSTVGNMVPDDSLSQIYIIVFCFIMLEIHEGDSISQMPCHLWFAYPALRMCQGQDNNL